MMESTISRSACYETRSACYEENNKDKLRCTGDWRRTSVGAACRLPLPALHVDCRAAAVIFAPSDRTSTMTCGHTRKPLFDLTTDIYDATLIDVHAAASRTGSIRHVMRPARWRRRTRPSASCSTDTRQIGLFRFLNSPLNSTMQKEDFTSYQNVGTCMNVDKIKN
jgi:hypothetical protein